MAEETIHKAKWSELSPVGRDFLFLIQEPERGQHYAAGWPLNVIFPDNGAGIVTAHDAFSICFSRAELETRFERFRHAKGNTSELHREFDVAEKAGWNILKGWQALSESKKSTASYIRPIVYAPFDARSIFYEDALVWRTVHRIMDSFRSGNIALLSSRITKDDLSALVVSEAFRHKSATRYDISYGFPLYLRSGAAENLAPDFRAFIDARYEHHYTAEEIFGYIYAVLYAPTYRTRYAELLRIDFPRVPFPQLAADFEALSGLGWALVQAHLLRVLPRRGLAAYLGKGDHAIEAIRYSSEEQAIWINKTRCFKPVPQNVWDFQIGGYQVLDKYLKSRKGRTLLLDEINHLAAVADSLAFTIDQMAAIDKAYRTAFPDRG